MKCIAVVFIFIFLLSNSDIFAQKDKKTLEIKYTNDNPKIDGVLDDVVWEEANQAVDFVMFDPGFGDKEPENQKTVVKVAFNDDALFIGAYLYESDPLSIPTQFTSRDNFGQSDVFEVIINPFNDGINDSRFYVMSTGAQADAKVANDRLDFSWNAVWESAVKIVDEAWVVEMKIPYAALRFSNEKNKEWGINFVRKIQSKRERYSWNYIDKREGNTSDYSGILYGMKDINTPLRLSFYPFVQGMFTNYDAENAWDGTGGLDVKYGINDSFTFDATLIPDFGQTAFDDVVLNLGPFEEQYEEKRAFFTEGTELFNKGNLFYTRRIGSTPTKYLDAKMAVAENEILIDNPEKTRMLNGIKLTGRSEKGLGIGVFNAFTQASRAIIRDTVNNTERSFLTDPMTNYNVLVLDQTLKRSSSISFVNTNVLRQGYFTDANVSSILLKLRSKNRKYLLRSDLSMSNKFNGNIENITDFESGFQGSIKLDEVADAHRFGVEMNLSDTNYDKNDLGIQDYSNYVLYKTKYSFRTFEPVGLFNSIRFDAWGFMEYRYKPYLYTDNGVGMFIRTTTRNHNSFGTSIEGHFGYMFDYYEPRANNRFFKNKNQQFASVWMSTDYRKKIAIDANINGGLQIAIEDPLKLYSFEISPRIRLSNKIQLVYLFGYTNMQNDRGYVGNIDGEEIIFGKRDYEVVENNLQGNFNINTRSAFTLLFRHYWAPVTYDSQLFTLQSDGSLADNDIERNYSFNTNIWNFDLSYSWEFAPGSQFVVLYRNDLYNKDKHPELSFTENIDNLFKEPMTNQLSLKLIYYLDYNRLKSLF